MPLLITFLDFPFNSISSTLLVIAWGNNSQANKNTNSEKESLSCRCISFMYNGIYKERYIGLVAELGLSRPRASWEQDFCLLFLKRLFVLWDSSCSGTWGWCPGSSACAQKCFGTYPSPLSPEKKQVQNKCHEKIEGPSWMMLIKMMMLTKINDNTWSWITLLLCMFALISSWTWGSGIIDHHGARSNSTI